MASTEEQAIELANKHWAFLERWLEMVFKDGFIHGYKHGREDAEREAGNGK